MDIIQRQSSTDFEDLDGSDFDSCDDDDIYDCPEQDNTYQAERLGDPDGQDEGDEIYDTPDDAKEQLAAMNSAQDLQHFSNHSNGHQVGASDQVDESSERASIANARAFFANKVNSSGPHPGVPVNRNTKPAIAQRWPPLKTEEMDVEAEKPRSASPCNEKHRAILNKLSRVIGDGKSWEQNNNASGNEVDQITSNASNSAVNAHPGIVNRSDRPNFKDSQSRMQPVMKPPRDIPSGKYQTAAYEAQRNENIPQPPYPRGMNSTSEIEDEEKQYIEPLHNSTAVSTPSFQSHSQMSKQEGRASLSNMPKPVPERQPNRTMNYADIIIDPVPRAQRLPKNNATSFSAPRNPSMQHHHDSTPEPFSEENYEVTGPGGEAPALPSGRPNMGKSGIYPAPQSGRQEFPPSNKPRAVVPPQENYKVPVSENPPALPPGRPGRRDPPPGHLPSRLVSAPARGTQAQDPSQENYEVPYSNNAPVLPPGRPDRRSCGISSDRPPRREGHHPPVASQPQAVIQENYEVLGSSNVPTLPPNRPDRRDPGLPSGQPQDVSQENYEVPGSGSTPGLPPGRPNKTDNRIPLSQSSSGRGFPSQNIAHVQDSLQENYEVPGSGSAPQLPPGRPDRTGHRIPPGQLSGGKGFPPQTQSQDLSQENYEVPDSGNTPQLPPGRPDRTGHRIPPGQHSGGKGFPLQSNTQPQDLSQENYEVPDSGSTPQLPPGRPDRTGHRIPPGQLSGGKGFPPQTQSQDLSQENYEVPDSGSTPQLPPGRPDRTGHRIPPGKLSGGKGFPPQSNTQPQDFSQENYEVPDSVSAPQLPQGRPDRTGHRNSPGQLSGGKGFPPQSNTQPQDLSQENYEVPDSGSAPQLPPGRPDRTGRHIAPGQLSGGKGFPPQSNTQPQDLSQENYEVPDSVSAPQLPQGRPDRTGHRIPPGQLSGGKGLPPQTQSQDLSQENYEVPDAGNAAGIPPDRPSRGGPGITFPPQSNTQPQDLSQDNYEVADAVNNVPNLPPGRPSRGGPGIPTERKSSVKGFSPQNNTETQDPSEENYEVPDSGNAPAVPPDRATKGLLSAPGSKNPAVPTKPKGKSFRNFFHSSKKQPQPKPSKPVKEKQDVQQPQNTSSSSGCSEIEQENYEVMDGENATEPQENYEIVDQTTSDKAHSGRCPPEGQEHRGGIGKPKRTFSPEDQMLNQVLVGLTNPQKAERQQQQPLSRKERPPSIRMVPPRPSDSEQPLLDLHELANATTGPDSQRSPVKRPKPPIEQELWYFCSIDRPGAERKLNGVQKDGAFIVRQNSNGVGYSISIYYQGDIRHLKIGKKGSGYHLGTSEKSFECVQDLIAYFKSFPIELKQGGKTKLTVTAPKS